MFDALLNAVAKMSKTPLNYWAEFAVDIPLGAALIFTGLRGNERDPLLAFLTILLGLFLFSREKGSSIDFTPARVVWKTAEKTCWSSSWKAKHI